MAYGRLREAKNLTELNLPTPTAYCAPGCTNCRMESRCLASPSLRQPFKPMPIIRSTYSLVLPSSVHCPTAERLSFLEHNHMPPSWIIDRIHVSASFDAHAASWSSRRHTVHFGHVDEPTKVELEGWLCAQCFEVDLGIRVIELAELLQWLRPSV